MRFDRITVDPTVHFGKPCVAGTRIPVADVLELIEDGVSFDDIQSRFYPSLERSDIQACVAYAVALVRDEEVHLAITP